MALVSAPIFTVCDAASIREGLLNVLGSGISRIGRATFPAEFTSTIAVQLLIEDSDLTEDFTVRIELVGENGEDRGVPSYEEVFGQPIGLEAPDEPFTIPLVLSGGPHIPSSGRYKLVLFVNKHEVAHYFISAREIPA